MDVKRIAIGSTNPVKVAATKAAIQHVWPAAEIYAVAVASGVRAQPLSDDEAILGATNRARNALAAVNTDLAVGLEGNTHDGVYGMFGTGWAVVTDASGTTGIGGSGRFLLPQQIADRLRVGGELGPLMDLLTGQENTRHRQGAIGIFTNNLITRQSALETALLFALTRFLNPHYYE